MAGSFLSNNKKLFYLPTLRYLPGGLFRQSVNPEMHFVWIKRWQTSQLLSLEYPRWKIAKSCTKAVGLKVWWRLDLSTFYAPHRPAWQKLLPCSCAWSKLIDPPLYVFGIGYLAVVTFRGILHRSFINCIWSTRVDLVMSKRVWTYRRYAGFFSRCLLVLGSISVSQAKKMEIKGQWDNIPLTRSSSATLSSIPPTSLYT